MTRNRFCFSLFTVVIGCVVHPDVALAATDITAATASSTLEFTDVLNNPANKNLTTSDTDNTLGGEAKDVSANAIDTYGRAFGDVTATAHAEPGDLGVKFLGNGDANAFNGFQTQMREFATASWRDTGKVTSDLQISPLVFNVLLAVTNPINLPTHAGGFTLTTDGTGTMDGSYEIQSTSSFYQFPPGPYPIFGPTVWANFHQDATGVIQDFPAPETIPVRIVSCNGCEFEIGFQVTLRGSGSTGEGKTIWQGDFSGSLQWAGVQSVTDEAGNLIPRDHWSITSESGFDYSKPFGVPEPCSMLLLGTTLPIVLAVSRARMRSRLPTYRMIR